MASENKSFVSIGFPDLLALIFITLKLTGHIAWSWWWVLSPLWLPLAAVLAVLGAFGIVALVAVVVSALFSRPKRHSRF